MSGVAVGLEARNEAIDLDPGRLAEAAVLLVPFTLVFAAVGALLAARLPEPPSASWAYSRSPAT